MLKKWTCVEGEMIGLVSWHLYESVGDYGEKQARAVIRVGDSVETYDGYSKDGGSVTMDAREWIEKKMSEL